MKSESEPTTHVSIHAGIATQVDGTIVKPMLHAEHLEQLIDAYGLPRLLATFAEIAHAKAEHVQTNWQDAQLAKQWTVAATKLERLSFGLPRHWTVEDSI